MNITVPELKTFLADNADKRICVVGTTCSGKSTLARSIPGAIDMDDVIFRVISNEDLKAVSVTPWTPEVGVKMEDVARRTLRVEPGKPVFGTVVFDADVVVLLDVVPALLRERCELRGVNYDDALRMNDFIRSRALVSGAEMLKCEIERPSRNAVRYHSR